MPVTRRRRANPPDQPENNNHVSDQLDNAAELSPTEHSADASAAPTIVPPTPNLQSMPEEPENPVSTGPARPETLPYQSFVSASPAIPQANGDHLERQDYTPTIEGGRRTARGELFRRPPQPPPPPATIPTVVASSPPLQAPSHEISLPLGNLLHLAYNPSYTGADEARSTLLQQLANESKSGGRARCWSCGSLGIVYDRWNTRSKTFGEVGVAFCEICGVWSVM